jgi:hypothetical protein
MEVEMLKTMFQELLDTRRFEINDFLKKSDSSAIMDLAQAASIFRKSNNYKALGICYNNIANVQYKNAHYNEASLNFKKAILAVEKLMDDHQATLGSVYKRPSDREKAQMKKEW